MDWEVLGEPKCPSTPEEAYSSVVDSVVNLDTKTVTVLAMDERPRTKTWLYEAVADEAGTKDFGRNVPFGYCEDSLEPIGAVTKCEIIKAEDSKLEGATAYSLSKFGEDVQPLMSYFIKAVSESNELDSMWEVLGPTYSSGEGRAPTRISKILYEMRVQENPTVTQIMNKQDLSDSVKGLTDRLAVNELIEKKKPASHEGRSRYRVLNKKDDVEPIATYPSLTEDVVELLEEGETIDYRGAAEELRSRHRKPHQSSISEVLGGLEDQGILEREHLLSLTEKGEEALGILDTSADYIIHLFEGGEMPRPVEDSWNFYQENTQEFRRKHISHVWLNCRLKSPHVDSISKEEGIQRVEKIVEDLEKKETTATTANVWEEYKKQYKDRTRSFITDRLGDSPRVQGRRWEEDIRQKVWSFEEKI